MEKALQKQLDQLFNGNRRGYRLSVMLYRETGDRVDIVRMMHPTHREKILEVGGEGGSLSILRERLPGGAWRFTVLRDETALADLLDSTDQEGLDFSGESGSVDTLAAALQLMDRYPWHRLLPLTLHKEYAAAVMVEVLRRGGTQEAARWKSELSRRFDRPGG